MDLHMDLNPVLQNIFFVLSALLGVVCAVCMVTRRNPLYSALWMVLFFSTVSVEFLLLEASFLAFMQLLVYAGAIMVLYLFVIMLINPREENLPDEGGPVDRLFALGMSVLLFVLLVVGIGKSERIASMPAFSAMAPPPPAMISTPYAAQKETLVAHGSVQAFGQELFSQHLLVFELTSILILVAIVGAVHLSIRVRTKAKKKGPRKVNVIPEHVKRRREERREGAGV